MSVTPQAVPNPATTNWVPVSGPVGNLGGGFEFGYDQITAPVTVTGTVVTGMTTIIPGTPHVFDGNPVLFEFSAPYAQTDTNANMYVHLVEGGTTLGCFLVVSEAANLLMPLRGSVRFTPSAGTHTYSVMAYTGGGASTARIGAGPGGPGALAYYPAYLRASSVAYYTGPGAGIPSPVTNGQFVKGAGGAAVWSQITQADVANYSYSTTLPASPFDGQEAILVDAATPTYVWKFRYNAVSTSAYKWEFIGGTPAVIGPATPTPTGGGTGVWSKAAPLFTIPRAGDYAFAFAVWVNWSSAGTNMQVAPWVKGASDTGSAIVIDGASTTGSYATLSMPAHVCTGLPAGDPTGLAYYSGGSSPAWGQARLEVTPRRVS